MSAFILFPVLHVLLNGERIGTKYFIPVIYQPIYYISLVRDFMSPLSNFGVVSTGVIAILLLLLNKGYRKYKIALLVFLVILGIPFFSHVINGFAYVSDRWAWAFVMFVSMVVVKMFPYLFIRKRNIKIVVTIILGFVIVLATYLSDNSFAPAYSILYFILLLFIAPVFISNKRLLENLLFVGVLISVGINSYSVYSNKNDAFGYKNYVRQDETQAYGESILGEISRSESVRDENYRTYLDGIYSFEEVNSAMLLGVNGTEAYFSLMDGVVPTFYNDLYIKAVNDFRYEGLDNRIILNSLLSVKYILSNRTLDEPGYQLAESVGNSFNLYENTNVLPIGYTYDSVISKENWDKMSPEMKEKAMLQGIVLEDGQSDQSQFRETQLKLDATNLEFQLKPDENMILGEKKIEVLKEGATLTLQFDGIMEKEIYFMLKGFDFDGKAAIVELSVNNSSAVNNFIFYTDRHTTYSGRKNFIINTGYKSKLVNEITITFNEVGIYSFDKMELIAQETKDVSNYIADLKKNCLEDIKIGTNSVKGTINLQEKKYLCFSIPYGEGWSAVIDGKEEKLLRANSMLMAVELDKGYHEVFLKYSTPFLKEGLLISGIGLLGCIVVVAYSKSKQSKIQ